MINEHVRRFILTSIDSVPHLEAILLLRYDQEVDLDVKTMAQKLYISTKRSQEILDDLCASNFVKRNTPSTYCFEPESLELRNTIDELADIYAKHLIEVTTLIHSKTDKQAQQFGDAFKWQTDKE
jgi:hypothetical protein